MSITLIIFWAVAIFLGVFDIWVIATKGKHESISAYVIRGSRQYPLLVLLFGILLGHLFWSMRTDDIYRDVKCIQLNNTEKS